MKVLPPSMARGCSLERPKKGEKEAPGNFDPVFLELRERLCHT